MKQSSIEWLVEQFDLEMQDSFHLDKINQAKEMHRQEIKNAYNEGVYLAMTPSKTDDEFYKNTYEKENIS